jgi:hypothetical protein
MRSPEVGALRVARAFGFGLTAFALSVVAHVAAGGPAPSATTTLLLGAGTLWVSVFLTWRRLGVTASVVSLGALQVVLHAGLSLASAGGACLTVVHSHAGHLASGPMTMCAASSSVHGHVHGIPGLAMTAAHAVAAVLLGVLLARADQAVWFLSALVWPRLPQPAADAGVDPGTPVVLVAAPARRPQWLGLAAVSRRGPPWGFAPAAA